MLSVRRQVDDREAVPGIFIDFEFERLDTRAPLSAGIPDAVAQRQNDDQLVARGLSFASQRENFGPNSTTVDAQNSETAL